MANKRNEDLGIYRTKKDVYPILKELERVGELDIRNLRHSYRGRIKQLADKTGIIEYVPLIRKKADFRIISIGRYDITIQKTIEENNE